jgi:hypothetical protein
MNSPYVADIEWLTKQRDNKAFVSMDDYCRNQWLVKHADVSIPDSANAVTLEISAMQYFPWLISPGQTGHFEKNSSCPAGLSGSGTWQSRPRTMETLWPRSLAMQIVGATWVESLDTRGTDGGHIHLGRRSGNPYGFFRRHRPAQ